MSLTEDISRLRGLLTTPDDPLFQHLSDLILALDDACSSTTSKIKRNCERKSLKVKRKIKRPHDKIDLSTGNIGGSESNVEEFGKLGLVSAEGTVEMTDSENELGKRRYSNPWSSIPHCNSGGGFRNLKVAAGQRSTITTTGVPIESDSFTETFTPARKFRRKRLIKRMAVDTCVDEEPAGNVRYRCNSASNMDVELAGVLPAASSTCYLFAAAKRRTLRKTGSCHSESSMECDISSSDTSDTDCHATSDEGHQGDDEQSDWYFEIAKSAANKQARASSAGVCSSAGASTSNHDECVMGVPNIRKMLMRRMSRDQAIGLNHYMQTIESSDTDMSQSSNSLKFSSKNFGRRLLSKNAPSMSSALNKRIVNFLHHPGESEVQLGTLKKRERKEALRLASFYNLDIKCKTSKGYQTYTLLKTKYTVA